MLSDSTESLSKSNKQDWSIVDPGVISYIGFQIDAVSSASDCLIVMKLTALSTQLQFENPS